MFACFVLSLLLMDPLTKFIPDSLVHHLLDEYHYSTNFQHPTAFGNMLEEVWRKHNTLARVHPPLPATEEKLHPVSRAVHLVIETEHLHSHLAALCQA